MPLFYHPLISCPLVFIALFSFWQVLSCMTFLFITKASEYIVVVIPPKCMLVIKEVLKNEERDDTITQRKVCFRVFVAGDQDAPLGDYPLSSLLGTKIDLCRYRENGFTRIHQEHLQCEVCKLPAVFRPLGCQSFRVWTHVQYFSQHCLQDLHRNNSEWPD